MTTKARLQGAGVVGLLLATLGSWPACADDAFDTLAEGARFSIGVRGGVSVNLQTSSDVETAINGASHSVQADVDDDSTAAVLTLGWRVHDAWVVELSYFSLGETRIELSGVSSDVAALERDVGAALAEQGQGGMLGLAWRQPIDGWELTPRLAVVYAESRPQVSFEGSELDIVETGIGGSLGASVSKALDAHWHAGISADGFWMTELEEPTSALWSAQIEYRF